MGCCGGSRRTGESSGGRRRTSVAQGRAARTDAQMRRHEHAYFQYVGDTAVTVLGPVTGRRYRFSVPGAVVAVDPRDRRSVAAVPTLREVAHP